MVSNESCGDKLHILFFPLMSPGHMIPMVDMALLFSQRPDLHCSLVTTPVNAANIRPTIESSPISLLTISFPDPSVTGLAPGQENLSSIPASGFNTFISAIFQFRDALAAILRDLRPDALISDSLFTWTADLAIDFGIPRLIFHGAGAFPLFVTSSMVKYLPVVSHSFVMDGLPHKIQLYKDGLPELFENFQMLMLLGEAEAKSYGVVINTFREMEPTYVDHYKTKGAAGNRAWCVGPVSLCSRAGRAERGEPPAEREDKISSWLDAKEDDSVVYVCFGSLCHFGAAQLREIAVGLEQSGQSFIWVVRREAEEDQIEEKEWMPEGFEERVKERGLVIRGWAPQMVVLAHRAVGWFVTHCGWNSLLEGACAGVGLVTWPLFHEQFVNQELAVEVMKVGFRVWEGLRRSRPGDEGKALVVAEEVAAAVKKAMAGGEEMEGIRKRAREYAEMAKAAVEPGGSTYEDVGRLIEALEARRKESVSVRRGTRSSSTPTGLALKLLS